MKGPFTLTMLGTDTVFTPTLKKAKHTTVAKGERVADYPKGETLSIVSNLINTQKQAVQDNKGPMPYQADEIVVVNGPVTTGSNVGEKIALGLASALKAIARGQFPINIIAHSRGAVESILIAHELEAIKNIISTCEKIDLVLIELTKLQTERWAKRPKDTPRNNTPDIIDVLKQQLKLIPATEQDAWFAALKANMPKVTVNFLGLDPVPGDCSYITWHDERFYKLPSIIENAEIVFYENERTDWGFTPMYPETVSPKQNYTPYTVPGHHGTGSNGNNGSQQKIAVVAPGGGKTTHVQKLILFKMLNFLNQHGVKFQDGRRVFKEFSALGRKYITQRNADVSLNEPLDISSFDFQAIFLKLYTKIAKNRKGYEEFNKTSYPYLGVVSQRRVLRKGAYGALTDVFPFSQDYVNKEHADLMSQHFLAIFKLNEKPESLAAMVDVAHQALEKNIRQFAEKQAGKSDLSTGLILLENDNIRQEIIETFDIVIQRIGQQYLTDDWSAAGKQAEKQKLFQAIIAILAKFTELAQLENQTVKQFVNDLTQRGLLRTGITVSRQLKVMEAQFKHLQQSTDERLKHFFNGLIALINKVQDTSIIDTDLIKIFELEEFKKLANYPIGHKIKFIFEQLKQTSPDKAAALTQHITKGIETARNLEQAAPSSSIAPEHIESALIKNFEEQYGDSLKDFEKLHHQAQIFIDDVVALRRVMESQSAIFNHCEAQLHYISKVLVETAAQRFYCERPDALPAIAEPKSFMGQAERYAIVFLGVRDRTKATQDALLAEQQALVVAQKELSRKAATCPKEAEFSLLITKKLRPLTQRYLTRLETSHSSKEAKTVTNIEHLKKLLACLDDTEKNVLASARVRAFYTTLNDSVVADLSANGNDDMWRYVRNALILGGILITGILPGLAALAVYNTIGHTEEKSLYFWRTPETNLMEQFEAARPSAENPASMA